MRYTFPEISSARPLLASRLSDFLRRAFGERTIFYHLHFSGRTGH
jgi:hypothetical protein